MSIDRAVLIVIQGVVDMRVLMPWSLTRRRVLAAVLVVAAFGCGSEAPDPTDTPALVEASVFFANERLGDPCGEVFPVVRQVDAGDPVRATLESLLAGPTAEEMADGYGGWFSAETVGMLVGVRVDDGVARVEFRDLRLVIPNASTSCGSAGLLAQLDQTLLAFDHIDSVRYALVDEAAFYEWLQLAPPDALPAVDLEAGWTLIEAFDWPVEPGFSGLNTVGPISPAGAIPADGWPADGFYEAAARRSADDLAVLHLTLRRWVACDDVVDSPCPPDDSVTDEDRRITPDPASEVERTVPIDSVRIVLVPIHDSGLGVLRAIEGDPGAFATLLTHGIDPAYREWVDEPFRTGATAASIQRDLLDRSQDPGFPFGVDYTAERDQADPVAYRGPLGTSLVADPTWTGVGQWPPGPDGLYGWQVLTLEVRDGQPILYIWAGPIAS